MAKSVAKLHVPIVIPDRDYTARAVVDWVAFVVKLGRTSHGGYLKRLLEPYGVSRVIPLNVGSGGAATEFRIEMQHPEKFAVIREAISLLQADYSFTESPRVL